MKTLWNFRKIQRFTSNLVSGAAIIVMPNLQEKAQIVIGQISASVE